jgi:hypothetical protein
MPRPPKLPALPNLTGAEREALANWYREQSQQILQKHDADLELARSVVNHPSPFMQNSVRNYAGLGYSKKDTAKMLGVSMATFAEHYDEDYEVGKLIMMKPVLENLMRMGTSLTDPNNALVAFKLAERRIKGEFLPPPKQIEDVTDKEQKPVFDITKLTVEQRAQLREMIEALESGQQGEPIGPDEPGVIP